MFPLGKADADDTSRRRKTGTTTGKKKKLASLAWLREVALNLSMRTRIRKRDRLSHSLDANSGRVRSGQARGSPVQTVERDLVTSQSRIRQEGLNKSAVCFLSAKGHIRIHNVEPDPLLVLPNSKTYFNSLPRRLQGFTEARRGKEENNSVLRKYTEQLIYATQYVTSFN